MPTSSDQAAGRSLRAVIGQAVTEAQRLLDAADSPPLDVVSWLSAHLTALDHSVYPVVSAPSPMRRLDPTRICPVAA